MIDKKTFKKSVGETLRTEGFANRGQAWYFDGADAVAVVDLQKSDWGDMYFVNVAFWLKAMGQNSYPREELCHVRLRAERMFPEDRELILTACTLPESDKEMLKDFSQFIKERLVPFCKAATNEAYLRRLLSEGKLERAAITVQARERLSKLDEE